MIEIFKALSEETRLRIFAQILKGDMCVCEIEGSLELTQSNASRHLTALKRAGILQSYKNAQWAYYRINDDFIRNNKELYEYLIAKTKELPTYEKDSRRYSDCKSKDMCSCKNNDKEDLDNE